MTTAARVYLDAFLAPLAGYLNDRYAKTTWLVGGNAVKLLGTMVCGLSIWLGYEWQIPGYLIVGVGSCLYGPAKYGILPEILASDRLVKANGTVELLTLLAMRPPGCSTASLIPSRLKWVNTPLTTKVWPSSTADAPPADAAF